MGSLLMKLRQSNFNLRSPDCYLVRSYLIATVKESTLNHNFVLNWIWKPFLWIFFEGKIVFRIFWKGTLIHVLKRWHLQGVGKKLSSLGAWSEAQHHTTILHTVHCGEFNFLLSTISSIWETEYFHPIFLRKMSVY